MEATPPWRVLYSKEACEANPLGTSLNRNWTQFECISLWREFELSNLVESYGHILDAPFETEGFPCAQDILTISGSGWLTTSPSCFPGMTQLCNPPLILQKSNFTFAQGFRSRLPLGQSLLSTTTLGSTISLERV